MSHRTVFHVPHEQRDARAAALGNAANLLADDTVDVEVAVVFNAGGIAAALAGSPHAERVGQLAGAGVKLLLCGNTLAASGYDERSLAPGIEVVSSAIAELTRRQADGYAYVRP
ncbi:DsrE family protein [Halosegnis sp.]|uniref:DsrE family protein n=1 Tax=Halosegnis sp. TaxID=2864959 RepID=UPI0035D4B520